MISNKADQMTKFHWYDNTTRNYKRRNVTRFLSASLPQMFGLFKVLQKYFSLRTCVTWRDVCDESVSWARDKALGNEMGRGADSWDLLLYHTLSLFIVSLLQSTDPKSHVTYLICWHDIGVNVTPAQCATLCVTGLVSIKPRAWLFNSRNIVATQSVALVPGILDHPPSSCFIFIQNFFLMFYFSNICWGQRPNPSHEPEDLGRL